ncbi:hypothetical protein REPUB_Repub02eG0290100 [Reevesia pubescens]
MLIVMHSWYLFLCVYFSLSAYLACYDVNMAVAVEAIQAIENLARVLRTHFFGSSHFLLPILLVEGLQDLDQSVEIFIRFLCSILGWNEKNVQVQQQVIEVVTYLASSATRFPKKCVVLCLLGSWRKTEKIEKIRPDVERSMSLSLFYKITFIKIGISSLMMKVGSLLLPKQS